VVVPDHLLERRNGRVVPEVREGGAPVLRGERHREAQHEQGGEDGGARVTQDVHESAYPMRTPVPPMQYVMASAARA